MATGDRRDHDTRGGGAAAVRRAAALLQVFTAERPELRLTDLARSADLSPSTTHRLLTALVDEGFVTQDPATERYRLGPTMLVLGQRAAASQGFTGAQQVLDDLTASSGESASLAVRSGAEVVVALVCSSPQRLRFDHGVGSRIPLHASAMGKVLLAATPDLRRAVEALGPLERFTPATITDPFLLVQELERVRQQGWAANRGERYLGVVGVAAPVPAAAGRSGGAAVGVQGPEARLEPDDALVRLVQAAGRRLATVP